MSTQLISKGWDRNSGLLDYRAHALNLQTVMAALRVVFVFCFKKPLLIFKVLQTFLLISSQVSGIYISLPKLRNMPAELFDIYFSESSSDSTSLQGRPLGSSLFDAVWALPQPCGAAPSSLALGTCLLESVLTLAP